MNPVFVKLKMKTKEALPLKDYLEPKRLPLNFIFSSRFITPPEGEITLTLFCWVEGLMKESMTLRAIFDSH